MNILQNLKRWIMNIFNITKDIIPEANEHENFYENFINYWKQIYQAEREQTSFQNADGKTRYRDIKSLRMGKVLAEYFTSLVYSENVNIKLDNEMYNEYVATVLEKNDYISKKSELLEFMFALGGSVEKIYRKENETVIDYVIADAFIPTQYNNEQIYGGVFLTYTSKGKFLYTLVESHSFKDNTITIESKLYKQNKNEGTGNEGVEVPLNELYPDIKPIIVINNIEKPLFSYCKPSIANNIELDSPLGISVFENVRDTLQILDTCFDSWEREFKLGKKRILVPSYAIKTQTLADGTKIKYFDDREDVFAGLNLDSGELSSGFKDDTQTLRIEEHVSSINALLNVLCMQVGLSAGTFSFDKATGLKTATEVISENSKTFRTKKKHEKNLEKNLKEVIKGIINVGIITGDLPQKVIDYTIEIEFDDSIIIDKEAQQQKAFQEVMAGLLSKKTYMIKYKGMTEEEAEEELKLIKESFASDSFFLKEE